MDEQSDPARYSWQVATPSDPDHVPHDRRLLHIVTERTRLKAALDEARRRTGEDANLPARPDSASVERLLTVGEVAELLGTTERFPAADRRTPDRVREDRRYVRIGESALLAFVKAGRVKALTVEDVWPVRTGAA